MLHPAARCIAPTARSLAGQFVQVIPVVCWCPSREPRVSPRGCPQTRLTSVTMRAPGLQHFRRPDRGPAHLCGTANRRASTRKGMPRTWRRQKTTSSTRNASYRERLRRGEPLKTTTVSSPVKRCQPDLVITEQTQRPAGVTARAAGSVARAGWRLRRRLPALPAGSPGWSASARARPARKNKAVPVGDNRIVPGAAPCCPVRRG